jgi:hypothetical protein
LHNNDRFANRSTRTAAHAAFRHQQWADLTLPEIASMPFFGSMR